MSMCPRSLATHTMGVALVVWLTACAGGPPAPDWQSQSRAAMDASVTAYLAGDTSGETQAFERARDQVSRTGRPDLMARAELMRCAARVASLVLEACAGFERVRADAAAPERAYAEYLQAHRLTREDIERLPPAQRAAAAAVAGGTATVAGVQEIADPLSRLIAIAVLFQAGQASPPLLGVAVETASTQGWRRPLLAWLQVQAMRAQQGGDADEAARLRRRIALVERGGR